MPNANALSMSIPFVTADVFTRERFGGNPVAIFPDARQIPEGLLQRIAREFNLSETIFIYPPDDPAHTRRVRIFTPEEELPFAGHPTIGAAFALASIGAVPLTGDETRIVLEEGVGPVPVLIRSRDGRPRSAQLTVARLPQVGPPPPGRSTLAEMLSLEIGDLQGGTFTPQAYSCGLPFLLVPVKDRDAVAKASVRMDLWDATLRAYWAPQVMVFAKDPELPGSHIRARVFVPGLAVPEDPATGSCAAALGGYLATRDPTADGTLHWRIEQGFEMQRPSIIELEVDKAGGEITAVRVEGEAVMVMEGRLEL
jgi:trans-2,3-dihydro-3-hydroxyanthranilate isomerase